MKTTTIIVGILLLTHPTVGLGQAAPSLSKYFRAYPFEAVEGVRFVDHPQVVDTVRNAIPIIPLQDMILAGDATAGPIDGVSGFMLSSACEPHSCDRHNWTIVAPIDGGLGAVCYFNRSLTTGARWFVNGFMVYDQLMLDCQRTEIPRPVLRAMGQN